MSHRHVRMQLPSENNGNILAIIGKVMSEMRCQGLSTREIEEYRRRATSGDYDNLLRVTGEYIDENKD